jgi:endo-1,4-beta-xylanase
LDGVLQLGKKRKTLLLWLLAATSTLASEVPLWPSGAPGSEGFTGKEVVDARGMVSNIHNPTLTLYLPPKEEATGAAVVICPGGGHRYLAIDHEGHDAAKWLASIGVAGFVLKYRLARAEGSTYKVDVHALEDGQRAIRMVRNRAQEWGVDPARVGMMGFSAGGEVTALAATRFDAGVEGATDPVDRLSSRPDFQVLVYPGIRVDTLNITKDTPPTFLISANDDRRPSRSNVDFYLALVQAGVPAELHIYARGGHGFGMRDRKVPVSSWTARLQEWMTDSGFLRKP